MMIVKFKFFHDIRRCTLEPETRETVELSELTALAKALYKTKIPKHFVFKYKDDENDMVTVSCQKELDEAIRFLKNRTPFFHRKTLILHLTIFPVRTEFVDALESAFDKVTTTIEKPIAFISDKVSNVVTEIEHFVDELTSDKKKAKNAVSQPQPKVQSPPQPSTPTATQTDDHVPEVVYETFDDGLEGSELVCSDNSSSSISTPSSSYEHDELEEIEEQLEELEEEDEEDDQEEEEVEEEQKEEEKQEQEDQKEEDILPSLTKSQAEQASTYSFEMKLKHLEEMGFTDRVRNILLLVKHRSDMLETVKELLSTQK